MSWSWFNWWRNVIFQVIEFVQFKDRLQHSSQYLVAHVESSILQLKQSANNIEEEEVIHAWNVVCFITFLDKLEW